MTDDNKILPGVTLSQTPIIQILPHNLEGIEPKAIRARVEEIGAEVDKAEGVIKAASAYLASLAEYEKLTGARDALNRRGKELLESIGKAEARLDSGLVDQFTAGGPPVDTAELVDGLLRARAEQAATSRVLEKLVIERIPPALVDKLRTEATLLWVRASEFERLAHVRFSKTVDMLRDAVEYESSLSVDIRKTFSGVLLTEADSLRTSSRQLTGEADSQERGHRQMLEQLKQATKGRIN